MLAHTKMISRTLCSSLQIDLVFRLKKLAVVLLFGVNVCVFGCMYCIRTEDWGRAPHMPGRHCTNWGISLIRVLLLVFSLSYPVWSLGKPWTFNPAVSASQVARIIGKCRSLGSVDVFRCSWMLVFFFFLRSLGCEAMICCISVIFWFCLLNHNHWITLYLFVNIYFIYDLMCVLWCVCERRQASLPLCTCKGQRTTLGKQFLWTVNSKDWIQIIGLGSNHFSWGPSLHFFTLVTSNCSSDILSVHASNRFP